MNTNEHLYSELLKIIKQKELEKENALYKQIELEPPPIEQAEQKEEDKKEERGVSIIDLM